MRHAHWIAVDWGTTNLRAWAMGPDGEPFDEARSAEGMATLERGPHGFEPALMRLAGGWLAHGCETLAVACGMVGSRQGWAEAPYLKVPAKPLGAEGLTRAPTHDRRLALYIANGVSQSNPWDVMRGEETQIAGLLTFQPDFQGVVALPGTHSKWVQIVDGEIFHFASFMTGELYALLCEHSILRHSLDPHGFEPAAFTESLSETLSHPERVAARLFTLRAEHLLKGSDPAAAAAALSGGLLGLEFAAARPYWLGQEIALVAGGHHAERYALALTQVGAQYSLHDPDACVLAGLRAAHATLTGAETPA